MSLSSAKTHKDTEREGEKGKEQGLRHDYHRENAPSHVPAHFFNSFTYDSDHTHTKDINVGTNPETVGNSVNVKSIKKELLQTMMHTLDMLSAGHLVYSHCLDSIGSLEQNSFSVCFVYREKQLSSLNTKNGHNTKTETLHPGFVVITVKEFDSILSNYSYGLFPPMLQIFSTDIRWLIAGSIFSPTTPIFYESPSFPEISSEIRTEEFLRGPCEVSCAIAEASLHIWDTFLQFWSEIEEKRAGEHGVRRIRENFGANVNTVIPKMNGVFGKI